MGSQNSSRTNWRSVRALRTNTSKNSVLSSEQRLTRAKELLKAKDKVDENLIGVVLRDHGEDKKPSRLTICNHGSSGGTVRSVIFYPERKSMKVLYGKPCQSQYEEFRFS